MKNALYLIPVPLSDAPPERMLPPYNLEVVKTLRHFVVENLRAARRTLRRWDPEFPIDECEFHELNTHTDRSTIHGYLNALREGLPMGLMSDAGCPAVADPGSDIVAMAQSEGLEVVPLVGPSSILLGLMGSGFNGQGFAFQGYLPVGENEREARLRELESLARRLGQTQIFIETPYRNNRLLATMARILNADTKVCVACDLTDPERQCILTRTAAEWRKAQYDFDKRPAIFLIHVEGSRTQARTKGGRR